MAFKAAQLQSFTIDGAGPIIGDTEITFVSMKSIDGVALTMADFGAKGYMTLEPNSGMQEEQISFTGLTNNSNGTTTITGVSNVAFLTPYTETSGLAKTHAGGNIGVVSNTSGFYNQFAITSDDETITGQWTFTTIPISTVLPTAPTHIANKEYVDSVALSGAPNASTSVQGVVQEATVSQLNAGTATGSTGAVLFGSPADFAASIYGIQLPSSGQKSALASTTTPGASNLYMSQVDSQKNAIVYGADSVGTDAYAITPTPAISAYTAGMVFYFKAGTANTGGATLAVGSGGAKAIVKGYNTALATGDILQNQVVQVAYDSTNDNWLMMSPVAPTALNTTASYSSGTTSKNAADASTAQTIAHGLGRIPAYIRINAISPNGSAIGFAQATTVYNGSTQTSLSYVVTGAFSDGIVGTFTLNTSTTTGTQTGVVTMDATNITITWTKTGSPTGSYSLLWEAFGPTT